MTEKDTLLEKARRRVARSKLWGVVPERAILGGHWDDGQLIRDAVADLLRTPAEDIEE